MTNLPLESSDVVARGKAVLSTLGWFWLGLHQDKTLFRRYGAGLGELLAQRMLDLQWAVAAMSRRTVTLSRPYYWRRIAFRQSQLDSSKANLPRYGDAGLYFGVVSTGNVALTLFGYKNHTALQKLDVEPTLSRIGVLSNSPVAADAVLLSGTDFWVDTAQSALVFRSDPFATPQLPVINIYGSDGTVIDREISLWGFDTRYDLQDVANRFGAAIGIAGSSTQGLKDIINAALDCLTDGPALAHFRSLVSAWFDIPMARYDGEVVRDIAKAGERLVVATDRSVYQFHPDASPLVVVDQVLERGQALTDALQVLTGDQLYSLDGWALDQRWYAGLGSAVLAFPNEEMPVQVVMQEGKAKMSLQVYGDPAVARRFWNAAHTKGLAAGTRLANHFDIRSNPVGEPTAAVLPQHINPFRLLLEEVGYALVVVRVRTDLLGANALEDLALGELPKKLLPARYTTAVLAVSPTNVEYIGLDDPDTASDAATCGLASSEALSDTLSIDTGIGDSGPTAWIAGDPCPS